MESLEQSGSPNISRPAINVSSASAIDSVAMSNRNVAQPAPEITNRWAASSMQATSTDLKSSKLSPVSAKTIESPDLLPAEEKPTVPEWFLQSKEKNENEHVPIIEGQTGYNGEEAAKEAPGADMIILNDDYEIHSDVYAEARDMILSGVLRTPGHIHPSSNWINTAAFLLQSPQDGSFGFSNAVVHTIAKELKADLVSLGQEDVHDLCQYFWPDLSTDSEGDTIFSGGTIELFFEQDGGEEKKHDSSPLTRMDTFINTLLACKTKTSSPVQRPPLIVHLSEVQDFMDSEQGLQPLFYKLLEAVKELRKNGKTTIIVGTTIWDPDQYIYSTAWQSCDEDEAPFGYGTAVNISPVATKRAATTLDREIKEGPRLTRLRHLRRALRWSLGHQFQSEFLLPEALWELPDSAELKETFQRWSDETMGRLVRQIHARIALTCKVEPSEIFDIIARISRNKSAIDKSTAIFSKVEESPESKDGSPKKTDEEGKQDRGQQVEENEEEEEEEVEEEEEEEEEEDDDDKGEGGGYEEIESKSKFQTYLENLSPPCTEEEKGLFDCVVDPDSLTSSFESLKLNQELVDRLRQLLSHSMRESEGLLATETVNGAILYGPPGTGKTHLARILAKEASANFISITPADIETSWVGDTEKRTRALFSLARKLHPCVIFLDEADALFSQRTPLDRRWERTSLSQFLVEIDGLRRTDQSPFLLMATNRPANLDDAVCRRLPHIVHIGLPSVGERKGILAIFLKEERVDDDVNLDELARAHTRDFSGSDIRALCVQAAMIAQREVDLVKDDEVTDGPRKRVITKAHFRKALEYTRPTVDLETLQEIKKFSNRRRGSGLPF
ncbi:hypothetical protein CDV31_002977 [Fusarium ambrosium]|uniref:AAA+ ATPase domain-containing protein n=1 Tax=Fusarium ambrosium TaxID=131363 RepID=A0A428UVC3_9HYPO|nr:hypothetical protein CDV31_002977 [Fusarium ambrosium]